MLLLWPHTYMNRSGASVLAARDFYKLKNEDVLIVCDDFNLPLGKLRFRRMDRPAGRRVWPTSFACWAPKRCRGCASASARLRRAGTPLTTCWQVHRQDQPIVDEAIVRACRRGRNLGSPRHAGVHERIQLAQLGLLRIRSPSTVYD